MTINLEVQDVPEKKNLQSGKRMPRLEEEINLLKAENELLKKIRFSERGMKK
jgi:transposase